MYESTEQYQEIVRGAVRKLEKSCDYRIYNGEPGVCPRCGRDGIWDIATKGFIHHMGNSIYYSTVFNEWRCGACDNRQLADGPGPLVCRKTGGRLESKERG